MAYAYQSGEHKKNLNQRGFPSEHQDEYITLNQETISNINDRITKDFSEEVLLKVPGFFKDNNGKVKFSARWGMAIPSGITAGGLLPSSLAVTAGREK